MKRFALLSVAVCLVSFTSGCWHHGCFGNPCGPAGCSPGVYPSGAYYGNSAAMQAAVPTTTYTTVQNPDGTLSTH